MVHLSSFSFRCLATFTVCFKLCVEKSSEVEPGKLGVSNLRSEWRCVGFFFNSGCVQGHFLYLFSRAEPQLVFLSSIILTYLKTNKRTEAGFVISAVLALHVVQRQYFLFFRLPLFSRGAFQRQHSPAPSSLLTLEAVRRSAGLFDRSVVLHKLQVH